MTQIVQTKYLGEVEFEAQWSQGQLTIGKLKGGGYAYLSGQPVKNVEELRNVLPQPYLNEAIEYFENLNKMPVEELKRRIIINPDGSYTFDDGGAIDRAEDLIGYFGSGDALEQALRWFARELVRREEVQRLAETTKAGGLAVKGKATKPKVTGQPASGPAAAATEPEVSIKE